MPTMQGAVFDRRNLTETASFAVEPSYRIDDLHQVKLTTSFRYFRDQYVSDQRIRQPWIRGRIPRKSSCK